MFHELPKTTIDNDMLGEVSEFILRTNPKLSTNVKIITNGEFISLESFNSIKELSLSKFKNFKTYSNSKYNNDIVKFWNNIDKSLSYSLFQEFDNLSIKKSFSQQYETFYWSGAEYITSLDYSENYGFLAPIWLNDKLPSRFVIFKVKDPAFIDNTSKKRNINFKSDILDKCEIVKSFDLSENTKIGSYIRRYYNQKNFPKSPISFKDDYISYNGINYKNGEFTSIIEYNGDKLWRSDESVLEFDDYITSGFERNGVIVANLLNIEFLFDDTESEDFTFNRYFGLYCDFIEDSNFEISKDNLSKFNSYNFNLNIYDIYNNIELKTKNDNGVILPIVLKNNIYPEDLGDVIINNNSIFCILDNKNNLHSLKRNCNETTSSKICLNDKIIDLNILKGFKESNTSINCTFENTITPSSLYIIVNDKIAPYSKFEIYKNNVLLKEIVSIKTPVYNENLSLENSYSKEEIEAGCIYDMFFGDGDTFEIAKSITKAFNTSTEFGLKAYYFKNEIHILPIIKNADFSNYKIIFTPNILNNVNSVYISNNGFFSKVSKFDHIKCNEDTINAFDYDSFLKTNTIKGFTNINYIVRDYDNSIIENDTISFENRLFDVILNDNGVIVSKTNQIRLYQRFYPSIGRLSFYPVKDFEMSTYHKVTRYGDLGELNEELKNIRYNNENFMFDTLSTQLNVNTLTYLTSEYDRCYENLNPNLMLLSKTQPYICNWIMNNGVDVRENPYRLNTNVVFGKNNFSPNFINYNVDPLSYNQEWFYIFDVPPYLNEYNDIVDQTKLWSYIGKSLNDFYPNDTIKSIKTFEDNLRSTTINWFDVYFKRDHIIYQDNCTTTPHYIRKYSILSNGSNYTSSETFFRGAKIEFLQKENLNEVINNNINNIKLKFNEDLNYYKFTAIIVPINLNSKEAILEFINSKIKVIRNDVFKHITLIYYIPISYQDAFYHFTKNTNDSVQEIILDKLNRYNLYNIKNKNYKPITILGSGKILSIKEIDGKLHIIGDNTSFLDDFTIYNDEVYCDETGEHIYYKEILISNNINNINPKYMLVRIENVLSDTYLIGTIRNKNLRYDNVCDILSQYNIISNNYTYNLNSIYPHKHYFVVNANYEYLANKLKKCVFASIKDTFNNTNPNEIIYELVNDNKLFSSENGEYPYALKFIPPMENAKYNYLTLLFNGDYVNYGTSPNYASPMFRYSGNYTPLKNNVIFFNDPYICDIYITKEKEQFIKYSRFLNTCFDTSIKNFGIINDILFHRVNEINQNIFNLKDNDYPIYPYSNKFSIDHRNINIFNSNWDYDYFIRTMSNTLNVLCSGTLSTKENKSFFGSKLLSIPNLFVFETFSATLVDELNLNIDSEVILHNNINHIDLYLNIESILINHIKNNLFDTFNRFYTQNVEIEIKNYLKCNILNLFTIKEINLFVKETTANNTKINLFGFNLNNKSKYKNNLVETKNFGISTIENSSLNKKIVFNIKNKKDYTLGLSISIIKK